MHRLMPALALALTLLSGCTRQAAPKPDDPKPAVQVEAKVQPVGDPKKADPPVVDPAKLLAGSPLSADDKQEKYDAALNEALEHLARREYDDALVAMESARAIDDNDFIRGEIAKLRQRIDQQAAAKTTVTNIESVLGEGKAAEAAQLSGAALKEFGGAAEAGDFVKLRLQADALDAVQKEEDAQDRFDRFAKEGESALAEKNLRAAALALEQALLAHDDADLKKKLEGVRTSLGQYDALRAKAADLRKDPSRLEEAVAALEEAQKAWDTLPVRQELDEYSLALQKRRDTVSVADFEVRSDLGAADLGHGLAEELLPQLKPRFDLVERSQVGKVIAELKLEQAGLDDPGAQRELGKLAKVRYLVLGSIYRLGGVTVQARLVDVKTGLVVQTAKVVAPTPEEAVALAPDLARQLMMSDAEKMAYDASAQQKFKAPPVIDEQAPLPPPPPPPVAGVAAAPVVQQDVIQQPPPPPMGGLKIAAFAALPPPPAAGVLLPPPPPPAQVAVEVRTKKRLLSAVLQRGDFFFRIGKFKDAQRQFEFALNLAPGHVDVEIRIDRCKPCVPPPPPPPVVVVVPEPVVIVARPRVVVMPFLVSGNPLVVPPALGDWTPQQLAPYLQFAGYDIVDPAEVYWYMGSLGMTMNDLMTDPSARRWLGRAVGARFFLLGTIEQTASFDVSTYLIDAEFGYLQGGARMHVRSPFELRLRMGELAQLTLMNPAERQALLAQAAAYDALMLQGVTAMQQGQFAAAVQAFRDALRLRPGAIEPQVYLAQAQRGAWVQALQAQRQQYLLAKQAAFLQAQQRQWMLAQQAEQARLLAAQQTALLAPEQRQQLVQQRAVAQTLLLKQAQVTFQAKNFNFSVSFYESAVNIAPPPIAAAGAPDPWRELAQAKAAAAKQAQLYQAQLLAQKESDLRKQRELELQQAQQQLEQQQKQLEVQRQALVQKDKQAYSKALKEGQELMQKGDYDAAVGAFQVAQRLQKTAVVDNLLVLAVQRRALAQAKSDLEKQKLEAKLEAERDKRKAAELEAKRNQQLYLDALKLAQEALQKKEYDVAQAKFEAAGAVFQTDVVATELKKVAAARAADAEALKAKQREQDKAAVVTKLVAQGQAALKEQNHAAAVQAFQEARKVAPDNLDVLAGLTQAEQARDRQLAEARKKTDDAQRVENFQKLLKSGKANLDQKQYDAAVANLTEAVKLSPGNSEARAALKQAEEGRAKAPSNPQAQVEAKQKLAAYQKLMGDGRLALTGKRYEDAIRAFSEAQKQLPGDQASKDFLADAQKGKQAADDALALAAKQWIEEKKRADDVQKALAQGRTALAGRDLDAAAKAFAQAEKLSPDNAEVQRAFKDLAQAQKLAATEAQAQKKRQEDYQKLIDAGKQALAAKHYPDAVKAFSGAVALLPQDKAGNELLLQAQGLAKQQADSDAKGAKLQALLDSGHAALKAKDLAAAAKALGDAKQLDPANPAVQKALGELDKARQDDAAHQKLVASFQAAISAGQKALPKDPAAAVKSFTEATKLMPEDSQAQKLLKQAQQALADLTRQQEEAAKAAALEQQKKTQFAGLLKSAGDQLTAKRYADAKGLYEKALALYPTDPSAKQGLGQAIQGLDDSKLKLPPPPPPPPPPAKDKDDKTKPPPVKDVKALFQKAMQDGAALEKQQKYADAVKSYQEALQLTPNDPQASAGLKRAQFNIHLTDGQRYLDAMRWADAQHEFEAALKLFPSDANATKLLNKAKQMKK
jgi:tetratricopeptide (TPR) repeat protein